MHEAFGVYSELKASGLVPDVTVLGALAHVCAVKLKTTREGERQQDLVLLERAADLLQDVHDYKVLFVKNRSNCKACTIDCSRYDALEYSCVVCWSSRSSETCT